MMHELLPLITFYIFATVAVVSGLFAVTQRNPVRCVLFLVLAFFASSVLWMLVEAEFLSLILVLVYVGAVMTLFLFVVMMLNIDRETKKTKILRYLPFGSLILALFMALLLAALPAGTFHTALDPVNADNVSSMTDTLPAISNTEALGAVLYTDYLFAFELAAAILLVAIVAAITLAHRPPKGSKRQNILKQLLVRREDRVSLHKMKSEKIS